MAQYQQILIAQQPSELKPSLEPPWSSLDFGDIVKLHIINRLTAIMSVNQAIELMTRYAVETLVDLLKRETAGFWTGEPSNNYHEFVPTNTEEVKHVS